VSNKNEKIDSKIETYLSSLEKALRLLPVSERAEIVTEIKSHIFSALERDTGSSVENVLDALGAPETVANRYLAERGQTLVKPSVSPMVKWIMIGLLGTVAMSLIFTGAILFKFSPLVEVRGDKVKLLGGAISVDDQDKKGNHISGAHPMSRDQRSIFIQANNAKISLHNSDGDFHWECKIDEGAIAPKLEEKTDQISLDFTSLHGMKCEFFVPEKHLFRLKFTNGKIEVEKPHYNLDINGNNGKIGIEPDLSQNYKFENQVSVGKLDSFPSSDKPDAYRIHIELDNGVISKLNGD
jgi:hypothetical protein